MKIRSKTVSLIPALGLAVLASGAVLGAAPAHALSWYVTSTFAGALAGTASGIAVTDGTQAVVGQTYTIQSLTGILNALGQSLPISGPTTYLSATNNFVYRGPGVTSDLASATGISWSVPYNGSTVQINLYNPSGPGPITNWQASLGQSGTVTSYSIVPFPEPAPGPLPLLGAAAAFGCSRRLRRRQRQALASTSPS